MYAHKQPPALLVDVQQDTNLVLRTQKSTEMQTHVKACVEQTDMQSATCVQSQERTVHRLDILNTRMYGHMDMQSNPH